MIEHRMDWDWIEVPINEFAGNNFQQISAKFRGQRPVALLTAFPNMAGYVATNLLAPLHASFWAAPGYDGFTRKCYDSICHISSDKDLRTGFLKDMRLAKIKKADKQTAFFSPFADLFGFADRKVRGLGDTELDYPERSRLLTVGFSSAAVCAVKDFLTRETCELERFAFYYIDESARLVGQRGRSSLGSYLFKDITHLEFQGARDREQFKESVLSELRFVVSRLEDGIDFDTPVEPNWIIKGHVGFGLFPAMCGSPAEYNDEVAHQILSYRSRLIRLLGWPNHYHSIVRLLPEFKKLCAEMGLSEFSPYDVEAELKGYLEDMRAKYPTFVAGLAI